MRLTILIAGLAMFLAACGGSNLTPEEKQRRAENIAANDALWATRKPVNVGGKTIHVAVDEKRTKALIQVMDFGETVSVAQLEAAGRAASGCVAKDESILSFLSKDKTTPIETSAFKNARRVAVSLQC